MKTLKLSDCRSNNTIIYLTLLCVNSCAAFLHKKGAASYKDAAPVFVLKKIWGSKNDILSVSLAVDNIISSQLIIVRLDINLY